MQGVHDLIHTLLEDGEALDFVNNAIREHKQTEVLYGDFGSGLHLHLLCHALGWQWPVMFRAPDGTILKATHVERYSDELGRIGRALLFSTEPAENE